MKSIRYVLLVPPAYFILSLFTAASPQSISDVVKKGNQRKANPVTPGKVYTNQDLEGHKQKGSVSIAEAPSYEPSLTGVEPEKSDIWTKSPYGNGTSEERGVRHIKSVPLRSTDFRTGSERKEVVPEASAWLSGSAGYEQAMQERRRSRRPLILYFYTEWCGYCRQFDLGILTSYEFKQYMGEVISVRINPDAGPSARALAKEYGVKGYPSFLVFPARSDQARPVSPFRRQGDRWVAMAPGAFVQACKEASGGL